MKRELGAFVSAMARLRPLVLFIDDLKPDLQSRGLCRELELAFLTLADIVTYVALVFPGHRFPEAELWRLRAEALLRSGAFPLPPIPAGKCPELHSPPCLSSPREDETPYPPSA